jgi:hypothetical protein
VVSVRAAATIAHLRETGNWALIKIMPYPASQVVQSKASALEYSLRWPFRLVLILRLMSVGFSLLNIPNVSLAEVALTILFIYLFCAELRISVRYNCAIGLLASTLARSVAQANSIVYPLQAFLFLGCFAPLWWNYVYGQVFGTPILYSNSNIAILLAAIFQYGLLCILQLLITSACYSLAIRRVERLAE